MANPLSLAASVVGMVAPALNGTRLLIEDIKHIKNATKDIKDLAVNLQLVELALQSVSDIDDTQWAFLGNAVIQHAKATISSCSTICTTFSDDLKKWTKGSSDGKLSWIDRGNIGLLKQNQIKSISQQLQNCHITITSMVSTATLHSSIRSVQTTQDMERMLSSQQGEIASSITDIDQRLGEVESHLETSDLADPSAVPQQRQEVADDVLQQIKGERKALEETHQFLQDLLARIQQVASESRKSQQGRGDEFNVSFGTNHGLQMLVNEGTMSNLRFGGA